MKTTRMILACVTVLVGLSSGTSRSTASEVSWLRNLYDGFLQGSQETKPLVVYFACDRGWGAQLDAEVIRANCLDRYSEQCVFVRAEEADEDDKGNYAQLKQDLKIERLPTVVVLDVAANAIQERGRIVGYFGPDAFVANFDVLFKSWLKGRPEIMVSIPSSNPFVPTGWATYASDGLGFQIALPAAPSSLVADREKNMYSFGAESPTGDRYMVTVRHVPTAVLSEIGTDHWLRIQAETTARTLNGEAQDVVLFDTAGRPSCKFHVTPVEGGQFVHVRCVLVGNQAYTFVAFAGDEVLGTIDAELFFQSFNPSTNEKLAVAEPTVLPTQ